MTFTTLERVGESEHHRDTDTDQEGRVDQTGKQEHLGLELVHQFGLTRCALDISGRPWLVFKADFGTPRLGEWDTELIEHWFHSFAQSAGITLHIENLYGSNNHHVVESCFKALARALRQAVEIDPRKADSIPSTKGTL